MQSTIKYHRSHLHVYDAEWQELARKMWDIPASDTRPVEIDMLAMGFDDLNRDLYFTVGLRLEEYPDTKNFFNEVPIENYAENVAIRPYRNLPKAQLVTALKEPLMITQKAYYVFAHYIIAHLPGQISEDEGQTWLTAKQYYQRHADVIELSGAEVRRISLEQAGKTSLEEEPWDAPGVIWA